MLTRYSLPAHVVQGIINILNQQPAIQVRQLLNDIEAECTAQERTHRADEIAAAIQAAAQQPKPE